MPAIIQYETAYGAPVPVPINDNSTSTNEVWSANKSSTETTAIKNNLANIGKVGVYQISNADQVSILQPTSLALRLKSGDSNIFKIYNNQIVLGKGTYVLNARIHGFGDTGIITVYIDGKAENRIFQNAFEQFYASGTVIVQVDEQRGVDVVILSNASQAWVYGTSQADDTMVTVVKIA